jgi:hypothetical protein
MQDFKRFRETLPNGHRLVKFLKAVLELKQLHGGNEDIFKSSHITLPRNANWLTFSNPTLYIRDFYDKLFTKGFNRFGNPPVTVTAQERYGKPSKFFVIGTPGIAKSSFGAYLVARALFMGKTVVYYPAKKAEPIIFNPIEMTVERGSFEHVIPVFMPELDKPDTVYISDSHELLNVDAWTATITCPRRDRWYEPSKHLDARLVFFPAFTWDEIQEFSSLRLATVSKEEIEARFLQWDENVRYVCMVENDVQSQSLADALGAVKAVKGLSDLVAFIPKRQHVHHATDKITHFEIYRGIDPDPKAWFTEGTEYTASTYLRLFYIRRLLLPTERPHGEHRDCGLARKNQITHRSQRFPGP